MDSKGKIQSNLFSIGAVNKFRESIKNITVIIQANDKFNLDKTSLKEHRDYFKNSLKGTTYCILNTTEDRGAAHMVCLTNPEILNNFIDLE